MSCSINSNTHITLRQARPLWEAKEFANRIGLPLNYALTMHIEAFTECVDAYDPTDPLRAFRKFQRILSKMRRWLRRRGYPLAAIWTREAEGSPKEHVNVLLHLRPQDADTFAHKLLDWIGATHPNALRLNRCAPPLGANGAFRYIIKGGNALVRAEYGVRKKHWRDQGTIYGKRAGVTKALNAKAQAAFKVNSTLRLAAENGRAIAYLVGRTKRAA